MGGAVLDGNFRIARGWAQRYSVRLQVRLRQRGVEGDIGFDVARLQPGLETLSGVTGPPDGEGALDGAGGIGCHTNLGPARHPLPTWEAEDGNLAGVLLL